MIDEEMVCCSCGQLVPKAIVDDVLARRNAVMVAECFCGETLEAGLCPNGHDPVTQRIPLPAATSSPTPAESDEANQTRN